MYIANIEFSVFELFLMGFFLVAFSYQLYFYFRFLNGVLFYNRKLKRRKKQKQTKTVIQPSQPGVSVVIYARDEVENLRKHLPLFLEQDYPQFEIIVVNDGSTDDSEFLLTSMKKEYPELRSTFVPYGVTNISTKKLALTLGIKAAKYDWILLSDADCVPESKLWISNMARNFNQGVEFVLGYGAYLKEKTALNRLITFDTLFIALQYLGYAIKGKPYMGVGRNMAYRKKVFFHMKGFASNLQLRTGDDDLIVNAAANKFNTKVEISRESLMWSKSNKTLTDWMYDKERHLFVASFYNAKSKFRLSLEPFMRGLFYLSFILVLIFGNLMSMITVGTLFLVRAVSQLIIINKSSKHFGGRNYFLSLFVFDIYILLVNLFLVTLGRIGLKSKRIMRM